MEFTAEQIYGIIQKLIGNIRPVGESNQDSERLKNIQVFINVFNMMHLEIDNIAYQYKDRHEASVKAIANKCNEHLNTMGICNGECRIK